MAKYNSINDVVVGHINGLIEKKGYNKEDYPFQNDINSALVQLAAIYAKISDKEVAVAADSFTIVGALDAFLDVVDEVIAGDDDSNSEPEQEPNTEP